ncbi:uncharacterized protein LOC108134595 isoform X3 [Drosophila elegans]|nr:uncharacterized protein LOC108134595 isoform X3 [Drosophila elegans]
MDNFNVPKKVNRNVLKALGILQSSGTHYVDVNDITRQVKAQMRNYNPVANMEEAILESLCNLTNLGIVKRNSSSKYAICSPIFGRVGRALPNRIIKVPGVPGTPLRRTEREA